MPVLSPPLQTLLKDTDATLLRCPTTTSTTSSPRSEQGDHNNTTEDDDTDTISDRSCDSFCTATPYMPNKTDEPWPITLDPLYEHHLCFELLALYEQLLPTRESSDRRLGLVQKIERLLNTEWPNHDIRVHLFGSSVNDLGSAQSDVDLCITTPWNGLRNVRVLAKMFKRYGMQHVVCVPRAKVPIVRLFDPESQLACDINVNNTLALQNTRMIKTYVAIDPRVRPLIMAIKHWTKQRRLNDAANGGTLSTYTWTCMIINFLQMREPPVLPVLHQLVPGEPDSDLFCDDVESLKGFGEANNETLGGLLFAFFRRYAVEFDYEDQVVSVRHGRYLTKLEKGWHVGRNRLSLCVEEPFNLSRNLGNSADLASVQGLRVEFRRAFGLLLEDASFDLICDPFHFFHQELLPPPAVALSSPPLPTRSTPMALIPSLPVSTAAATSPPPVSTQLSPAPDSYLPATSSLLAMPIHPHASSPVNGPASTNHAEKPDPDVRPRHTSTAVYAPLRIRQPLPCCTPPPQPLPPPPAPVTVTIALPPSYGPKTHNRTVDSIFARYTNPPQDRRQGNVVNSVRRRPSSDWPTISSQAKRPQQQQPQPQHQKQQQHHQHHHHQHHQHQHQQQQQQQQQEQQRRRRWSTVKKINDSHTSSSSSSFSSNKKSSDIRKKDTNAHRRNTNANNNDSSNKNNHHQHHHSNNHTTSKGKKKARKPA
ncbi:hypothetical protein BCR43DRAFT_461104 [Syncephalastrum racemosum]|uniref:polynucleotide adenylyltransferase n=1 Tax=Syncephalastrum racemosum TaxID=13706 RepID=A0A1X2H5P2_SYNRA|nr:hypothetical protein BCR43DRAFT_461104 [Syncephalastrum racemosum]